MLHRLLTVLVLFGLIVGCIREESVEARAQRLLAVEPVDVDVWVGELEGLSGPEARFALVELLLEARPEVSEALCPRLPPGPERAQCHLIRSRPHLWTPRTSSEPARRPAAGPGSIHPQPQRLPQPFASVTPTPCEACETSFDVFRRAGDRAAAGDGPGAAALCLGITADRWRQECMFIAAESRLREHLSDGYTEAVGLCAASGDFLADCLMHLHGLREVSRPLTTVGRQWKSIIALTEDVRAVWAPLDADYGQVAEGQVWAAWLTDAYLHTHDVTGDPLDFLPPRATPHIRSAVALRLAQDGSLRGKTLNEGVALVGARLATRSAARRKIRLPPIPRDRRVLWTSDAPGEENIVTIPYVYADRRPTSDVPEIDAALAVLEAAARATPPVWTILDGGRDHPHLLVQQSAGRLRAIVERLPQLAAPLRAPPPGR